jgi:hypothetical protein
MPDNQITHTRTIYFIPFIIQKRWLDSKKWSGSRPWLQWRRTNQRCD